MAYQYIGKDIYKQLEQVMTKLDESLSEIKNLNKTIRDLREELNQSNELNKKLQEEIDRLKNKNNKNSSNSSKPSSTNITTPKKKTGSNIYNYKTCSARINARDYVFTKFLNIRLNQSSIILLL